MFQSIFCWDSLFGVYLQTFQYQVLSQFAFVSQASPVSWSEGNGARAVLIITHLSWLVPHTHFIDYYSQSPHVNFGSDYLVVGFELWSNIAGSSTSRMHQGLVLDSSVLVSSYVANQGNAEVAYLEHWLWQVFFLMKKYVFRLKICVNDFHLVDICYTIEDLYNVVGQLKFVFYFLVLLQQTFFKKSRLVAVLHEDCHVVFGFGVVIKWNYILVN